MFTEHTRLTIVTDTGPCFAQVVLAPLAPGLSTNRVVLEHLAQHQVGCFVTRTPSHPSAVTVLGCFGSWKQRHESQNGCLVVWLQTLIDACYYMVHTSRPWHAMPIFLSGTDCKKCFIFLLRTNKLTQR